MSWLRTYRNKTQAATRDSKFGVLVDGFTTQNTYVHACIFYCSARLEWSTSHQWVKLSLLVKLWSVVKLWSNGQTLVVAGQCLITGQTLVVAGQCLITGQTLFMGHIPITMAAAHEGFIHPAPSTHRHTHTYTHIHTQDHLDTPQQVSISYVVSSSVSIHIFVTFSSVCMCACLHHVVNVCRILAAESCLYVWMYLCMYACMYACMHVCMHLFYATVLRVCARMYSRAGVCMYVLILHTGMHMNVLILHTGIHTKNKLEIVKPGFKNVNTESAWCFTLNVNIHAYMHTCIHAYMHTCIHAYVNTYIHIHTHTYTHMQT